MSANQGSDVTGESRDLVEVYGPLIETQSPYCGNSSHRRRHNFPKLTNVDLDVAGIQASSTNLQAKKILFYCDGQRLPAVRTFLIYSTAESKKKMYSRVVQNFLIFVMENRGKPGRAAGRNSSEDWMDRIGPYWHEAVGRYQKGFMI